MIIKKTWYSWPKYKYTGYFLFGIIPLYIVREEYS